MSNVVSIINGQPIIPKPEIPNDLFTLGDSFTSNDGVRVHIMDSRWNKDRLEYLYSAHGVKVWAAADRFGRVS